MRARPFIFPVADLVRHFRDQFDLDGSTRGQGINADGGAGVTTRRAEDGDQQIRSAINDLGLRGEIIGAINEAADAHDALHARQVPEFRLEHRQQLQHARPRGFRRLRFRQLAPDFTGEGFTVGATRDLSGQKNQFTAPHGWRVVSHRRRNGGQGQAQRGESLGGRRRCRAVGRNDQAGDCQQTNHQGGFHKVFISVVVSRAPQRQNASGDEIVFGRLTALNSGAPHRVILNRERILDLNTRRITDRVKP